MVAQKRKLVLGLVTIASLLLSAGVVIHLDSSNARRAEALKANNVQNLKTISLAVQVWVNTNALDGNSLSALLACKGAADPKVLIKPADIVLGQQLANLGVSPHYLVSRAHMQAAEMDNHTKNIAPVQFLTDQGASYLTWCMTERQWRLAQEFRYFNILLDNPLPDTGFPFVWDRFPGLHAGVVRFLVLDDLGLQALNIEKFDLHIKRAEEWLLPLGVAKASVISRLESVEPLERAQATMLLGANGDKDDSMLLIPLLEHSSPLVRRSATWALGWLGDPLAKVSLLRRSEDADPLVRTMLARTLGRTGTLEDVPVFMKMLRDSDPSVRFEAIASLRLNANINLARALLSALDQAGDRKVLEVIEAVARAGSTTTTRSLPRN